MIGVEWSGFPWHRCQLCTLGEQRELKFGLCIDCQKRCKKFSFQRWRERRPFSYPPSEGDGWHVDDLPDEDPRVVDYIAAIHRDFAEQIAEKQRPLSELDVDEWVVWVIGRPAQYKWLKL